MANAPAHNPQEFVVTSLAGPPTDKRALKIVQSQVWNGEHPMSLGHPMHSVLERTDKGVRIRQVSAPAGEVMVNPVDEIAFDDLRPDKVIEVRNPSKKGTQRPLLLSIRAVTPLNQPVAGWQPRAVPVEFPKELERQREYRTSLAAIFGVTLLCWIGLQLWHPTPPPPDQVIPPEFAKLLLSPALKTRAAESKGGGDQKAPSYNVVQAFQSAAVKKTTSNLLNANAAKALLSKSNLLDAASSKTVVNQLFSAGNTMKQLSAGGGGSGSLGKSIGNVSLVGGGKDGAAGTGYAGTGKGGPGVAGQGNGMLSVASNAIQMDEGLTKDEVGKVIRQHLAEVRYCYESAMLRTPHLEGKLVAAFLIGREGSVTQSSTKETSGDEGLDRCILDRLGKWQFPHPRGKEAVHVSYPFIFKVLGT
jgi:TonB family protein